MSEKKATKNLELGKFDLAVEDYAREQSIDGVYRLKSPVNPDDIGGSFVEAFRIRQGQIGNLSFDLDITEGQINILTIVSGTRRFGHVHPNQSELWFLAQGHLIVGLYDARKESQTKGRKNKYVLVKGTGLYIPQGVIHSLINCSEETTILLHFSSQHFDSNPEETEEYRVEPKDPEFWDFMEPEET